MRLILTLALTFFACTGARTDIDLVEPPDGAAGGAGTSALGGTGPGGAGPGGVGGEIGLGGVAGFPQGGAGGIGGTGGTGGAGGSPTDCPTSSPRGCEQCMCGSCRAQWLACHADSRCADIIACVIRTGCNGPECALPCAEPLRNAGPTLQTAVQLYDCSINSGCLCSRAR